MRRSLVVITLLIITGGLSWWGREPPMTCERAHAEGKSELSTMLCLVAYHRDRDDRDLIRLAKLYVARGEYVHAEALAWKASKSFRHGDANSVIGDAHSILGYVALIRGLPELAKAHARAAYEAHTLAKDKAGLASDATSLSSAMWQEGNLSIALRLAEEGVELARELRHAATEMRAHIARAAALRLMGDLREADIASQNAIASAPNSCRKAWAHLQYSMSLAELEATEGLALLQLATAKSLNATCSAWPVEMQILLNEASLLQYTDPAAALSRVDQVELHNEKESSEPQLLRGYLAAHSGAFDEAAAYLHRSIELPEADADWKWEILLAQAELAEMRGSLGDVPAEHYYRKAIASVTELRLKSPGQSAYLVARHRAPYTGLISLLARQQRWRDALAVILELDASDMLRETAIPLHEPVPRATPTTVTDALVTAVLQAWRGRDLVISVAPGRRRIGRGRERAYRLRVLDGEVTGEDVGDANSARQWVDILAARADDREAARQLGKLLVPASASTLRLDVLAIGPLSKVPPSSLRDVDGSLLVEQRPIARVLALRARTPEAADGGRSVVLTNPRGDLPRAAAEGAMVATALAAEVPVRAITQFRADTATRAALWGANGAGLLHIAGHVASKGRWRALKLADGDVEPAEIVRRGLAPRLAVLAACGSADATDEEGLGSLAAAFLDTGTSAVVATDWSVPDEGAAQLMQSFYQQPDWRADPARALARVQQQLDATADAGTQGDQQTRWWMAFSVLVRPPVVLDPPPT